MPNLIEETREHRAQSPPAPPESVEVRGGTLRPGDRFWWIDLAPGSDRLEEHAAVCFRMKWTWRGWRPVVVSDAQAHEPEAVFASPGEARAAHDEHLSRSLEYHARAAAHYRALLEAKRAGDGTGPVVTPCPVGVPDQAVS